MAAHANLDLREASQWIHSILSSFVRIHKSEVPSVLYSFFALFSLLASYFLLLPLREDAGISLGTSTLPTLFVCSLVVTLLFTPAASAFLSRSHPHSREVALKQFYSFMAVVLLVFYFMYNFSAIDLFIDNIVVPQQQLLLSSRVWHQQHYQQQPGTVHEQQLQPQQHSSSRQVLAFMPGLVKHAFSGSHSKEVNEKQSDDQAGSVSSSVRSKNEGSAWVTAPNLSPGTHWRQGLLSSSAGSSRTSSSRDEAAVGSSSGGAGVACCPVGPAAAAGSAAFRRLQQLLQQQHDGPRAQPAITTTTSSSSSSGGGSSSSEAAAGAAPSSTSATAAAAAAAGGGDAAAAQGAASPSSSSGSGSKQQQRLNSRTGDAALSPSQRLLRAAFYVWVNVMNLVGISSLWARCADAFTPEAGARLFGFISAGATLGQLMGSVMAMLVAWTAEMVAAQAPTAAAAVVAGSSSSSSSSSKAVAGGPPASGLILISALLQLVAAQLVCRVRPLLSSSSTATVVASATSAAAPPAAAPAAAPVLPPVLEGDFCITRSQSIKRRNSIDKGSGFTYAALNNQKQLAAGLTASIDPSRASGSSSSKLGGSGSFSSGSSGTSLRQQTGLHLNNVLSGFRLILSSSYLLMLCGNLLLTYVVGSLMYFQRALVVSTAVQGASYRTAFFATLNTWSAAAILLMQLFATSSLLRVLGMTAALGLGPAICLASIVCVSVRPSPAVVAVFEIVRKVFGYAVNRPAREVLFTVVSRDEKYRAKMVIDTVVQRLGDAIAAAAFQVLDVQLSLGQAGVGVAGGVMCLVWLVTAQKLGQHHKRLVVPDATEKERLKLSV